MMNVAMSWLLASEKIGVKFLDKDQSPEMVAAMVILGVLVFGAIVFGLRRSTKTQWNRRRATFSSDEVFDRLCEANKLNGDEIFMMRRLTFDLRLENPLVPFVNSRLISGYIGAQSPRDAKIVRSLYHKLFDDKERADTAVLNADDLKARMKAAEEKLQEKAEQDAIRERAKAEG